MIKQQRNLILWALLFPLLAIVIFSWQKIGIVDSYYWGLHPRKELFPGTISMHFIHKDIKHLLSNITAMAVLTYLSLSSYKRLTWFPLTIGIPLIGVLTWVLGKSGSTHIGMSGVVYEMAFFLITMSLRRKDYRHSGILLIVIFLYGSLFWGLFPTTDPVSWEGHLAGAVVGVILGLIFKSKIDAPPKYRYEVEEELGIFEDLETKLKEQQAQAEKKKEEEAQEKPRIIRIKYNYKPNDQKNNDQSE